MKNISHINLYFIPVFILFICLISSFSLPVQAMGVRPLVIDLEMIPGETKDFEITLTPSEENEVVNLEFYEPVQMSTGALSYQEADSESFPMIDWIQLEKNRVELPVDDNRVVRGTVTAPFNAEGTNTAVIMVEPEVEEAAQGVTFKVRYAIRLNITIDRPGMRPRGELLDFELLTENTDLPLININLHNNSKMYYEATAEATIRNEQGRLVQRIEIKPPVSWQSGTSTTTIYPDAEVLFTGNITEPLYPGNYQLRLFFRYGNGMQLIEKKEIRIEKGIGREQRLKPIRIQPENISLELRPGAASSQVVEIENLSDEEVYLAISGRDIERDYPQSIYNYMEIQLRGEQEMTIAPYEKKRFVVTVKAPRELEAGGYYGYLNFAQNLKDKNEVYSLIMETVSGKDELIAEAEILSLYNDTQREENIYSIEIKNNGRIHLEPEGQLILKKEDGSIIKSMELILQDGVERILPGRSELMVAITERIPAGSYLAEVSISEAGQNICIKEFELEIEE